ncbi:GNAT family N-acetyltransferase [Sulfitobacter aestuariivivens]|uniref:GNAT family N-acetyltransferase n=1 Tax=Sulfitobacter aestuariivivens TaxID=2766981 RepID=UPI003610A46C
MTCGTFQVAIIGDTLVGAGGWTQAGPGGRGAGQRGKGNIRHFVTDPDHTRRGVARAVMTRVLQDAAARGVRDMACMSTHTAVPFYESMGFRAMGAIMIPLAPGIDFPAQRMQRRL